MSIGSRQANGNLPDYGFASEVAEDSLVTVSEREASLGLLVAAPPSQPGFRHALGLARAAVRRGRTVYWYAVDDGVLAVETAALRELVGQGVRLFACAYGAERRRLPHHPHAAYAGLGVVSDLMSRTEHFLCFT